MKFYSCPVCGKQIVSLLRSISIGPIDRFLSKTKLKCRHCKTQLEARTLSVVLFTICIAAGFILGAYFVHTLFVPPWTKQHKGLVLLFALISSPILFWIVALTTVGFRRTKK